MPMVADRDIEETSTGEKVGTEAVKRKPVLLHIAVEVGEVGV